MYIKKAQKCRVDKHDMKEGENKIVEQRGHEKDERE
jgi:hypothetical protein